MSVRARIMIVGCIALLPLGACLDSAAYRETRVITVTHRPESPVQVETENGHISLAAAPVPDVRITANLRAKSQQRLDEAYVVTDRRADGGLYISVVWPDDRRRSDEGVSFDIETPDAHGAYLFTSNGAITLAGASGEAELRTSNGSVTVRDHDGQARATTSNGRVILDHIAGPIRAHTSNGSIAVVDAGGPVDVRTSNGGVNISLSPASAGPVDVQTSNGSIDLTYGSALQGLLRVRASNGRIVVDDPRIGAIHASGSADVTLGAGDVAATLNTSNGSVRVKNIEP